MSALLKINRLTGGYHKEPIVKDVSFDIRQGDFVGIIGPNGSGKTTLLRLLTKILIPHSGEIFFKEKNIAQMSLKELSKQVSYVSQDTSIDFPFSVAEVVLLGRIPHLGRLQFEAKKDIEIAENSLSLTDSLSLKNKRIDELSFGERQRVIIAKALAQEPVLLFLDEPTAHLDISHQVQILNLLRKLNHKNNLTIVMIMHDLNLAAEYCSRVILFDKGKIFKEGTPHEVLTYQNIEAVYKTVVVVNNNPISNKPYVILVSQDKNAN